ncbi:MAG TPA: glycosyltransferase [Acidobacteriota bacterium]|nr:glycosyltransferase [Acidobacteriota bacterium]HNT17637.1 glycosyltransferase [Acidobacteriota bacterium]
MESRKELPLISWLYDPMDSCPMQREVASLADHVLCADGKDLALYRGKSSWCPLGYDDDVYGIKDVEKDIDLLISGSIGYFYRKRRAALEILGSSPEAKKLKCVFIGSTGSSFWDMRVRTGAFSWAAKRLQPQELAMYQSRAKICVNVHRDDCDKMVNPSFFSIPGSGSCQLAERRDHFGNFLSPGEDFIDFCGKDELLEKVFNLLENDELRNHLTRNGYCKVKERHTMKERALRVEKIISEIRRRERG